MRLFCELLALLIAIVSVMLAIAGDYPAATFGILLAIFTVKLWQIEEQK